MRGVIKSDRGARFWLCERSRTDPAFPRFPPLPVRACAGYERSREDEMKPGVIFR